MAALAPSPNVGSQLERAVIAWLWAAFGSNLDFDPATTNLALNNFYFSNDWRERKAPLVDVMATKSAEAVKHSRIENYSLKVEVEWPGVSQPGVENPDFNWVSVNTLIGMVMSAMSQSDDDNGFRVSAMKITQAGRRLAVLGRADGAGSDQDVENNADMATFYCDYLEYVGAIRAVQSGGEIWLKEIRNFELHGTNLTDASLFPALVFDGTSTLNWTFEGTDPTHWIMEKSEDGVNDWSQHAVVDGNVRTADIAATDAQYWRVRPSEDGLVALDPESNLVKATAS